MIRVLCVRFGRKFGSEWVNWLRAMVERNTTVPHSFECLTDDSEGLEDGILAHPLPQVRGGNRNKLALFQPGLFGAGDRVVYFDLDTLIVGNIDPLMNYAGRFAMLGDFRTERRLLMSGVMAWRGGVGAHLWEAWLKAERPAGSDQEWIRERCKGVDILQRIQPGIVSYKYHKLKNGPRAGDRIVCFHNRPKNADFPADHWVARVWKGVHEC